MNLLFSAGNKHLTNNFKCDACEWMGETQGFVEVEG